MEGVNELFMNTVLAIDIMCAVESPGGEVAMVFACPGIRSHI